MKELLCTLLLLGSFSSFAKEVCDINQSDFQDFSIRCSDKNAQKSFIKNISSMKAGKRNDLIMMKMMLNDGYDLKAAYSSDDSASMTWIFVK